jgi:hypothetical protein
MDKVQKIRWIKRALDDRPLYPQQVDLVKQAYLMKQAYDQLSPQDRLAFDQLSELEKQAVVNWIARKAIRPLGEFTSRVGKVFRFGGTRGASTAAGSTAASTGGARLASGTGLTAAPTSAPAATSGADDLGNLASKMREHRTAVRAGSRTGAPATPPAPTPPVQSAAPGQQLELFPSKAPDPGFSEARDFVRSRAPAPPPPAPVHNLDELHRLAQQGDSAARTQLSQMNLPLPEVAPGLEQRTAQALGKGYQGVRDWWVNRPGIRERTRDWWNNRWVASGTDPSGAVTRGQAKGIVTRTDPKTGNIITTQGMGDLPETQLQKGIADPFGRAPNVGGLERIEAMKQRMLADPYWQSNPDKLNQIIEQSQQRLMGNLNVGKATPDVVNKGLIPEGTTAAPPTPAQVYEQAAQQQATQAASKAAAQAEAQNSVRQLVQNNAITAEQGEQLLARMGHGAQLTAAQQTARDTASKAVAQMVTEGKIPANQAEALVEQYTKTLLGAAEETAEQAATGGFFSSPKAQAGLMAGSFGIPMAHSYSQGPQDPRYVQ